MSRDEETAERFKGLLIGTAVGDSLGLPAEGLSSHRIKKMFRRRWHHRFLFGRGMISDDTEHTIFVAESLFDCNGSLKEFRRLLARKLRWWLFGLPAGIGRATLRSIFKLWLGFSPERSGVRSAGNGPAMRSAIIGAYFADSPESISAFVEASTLMTHTDARAVIGALAIAHLAGFIVRNKMPGSLDADEAFSILRKAGADDEEWREILLKMRSAFEGRLSVEEFVAEMNLSRAVTGYIYHTVPVAVYSWLRHCGDFEKTLTSVLDCGGDTDTVGAIAGALAGVTVGEKAIPREWIEGIADWPRGTPLLIKLGECLSSRGEDSDIHQKVSYFWPGIIVRNALFMAVVLMHAARRLLPPF